MSEFEITIEDIQFKCFLDKKSRKNINVRIKINNKIYISKPSLVSLKSIERYLKDNSKWIIQKSNKINHLNSKRENYITEKSIVIFDEKYTLNDNTSTNDLDQHLEKTLQDYIQIIREPLDIILSGYNKKHPTVKIKKMKNKWGSCYVFDNVIYINKKLVHYPKSCLDYVLLHEYMHFIQPNHSKAFYELIKTYMPNYKEVVKYLKVN